SGTGPAFRGLVARHGPMVWRVCRAILADEQAAEDAFQATFLALAQQAKALATGGRPLVGWLHCAARRYATKARAARYRRAPPETKARTPRVAEPAAELSARELIAALDDEVSRLADVHRLPLLLCFWQGLTQDEAARRLGITPTAVKGRLERGRAKLAARLTRRGIAPAILLAVAGVALPGELAAKTVELVQPGA